MIERGKISPQKDARYEPFRNIKSRGTLQIDDLTGVDINNKAYKEKFIFARYWIVSCRLSVTDNINRIPIVVHRPSALPDFVQAGSYLSCQTKYVLIGIKVPQRNDNVNIYRYIFSNLIQFLDTEKDNWLNM